MFTLLPGIAFSQYLSKEFTTDDTDVTTSVALDVSVTNEVSLIPLPGSHRTSGLFVSGCTNLANNDDSYVRITLKDTDSNEYLIYELYPILAENGRCPFSKIGLESAYLDNIHPQSIRVETLNASVTLDSVYFVTPERSSRNMAKAIPNRKSQCEFIANRLNEKLVSGNKTWRAGVTFVSQMTFEEKKWLMGKNAPVLYGFDYYKGGVFVLPGFSNSISKSANTRTSDDYVTEWDWRNRHGKNWVTDVKDQGSCTSCWAFSAVGTFESYINLYYNQLLNLDLSEQEIISFCQNDDCYEGGYLTDALSHIKNNGAIYEIDFPYCAANVPYAPAVDTHDCLKIDYYSNDYYDSYRTNHSESYSEEEDSIKRMLFNSPICFGIKDWWHFVVLVGFKQVQSGNFYYTDEHRDDSISILPDNPLIGHPAWLIKNSYGTGWGQDGFGYVAMSLSDAYGIHKLTGNVTSNVLTDSDIVCEDADGDGYFNWGIGPRPASVPSWAPMDEDGDDSDRTKGPIDAFGHLQPIGIVQSDTLIINSDTEYVTPRYNYQHIKVCENVFFTISSQLLCYPGTSITIEEGAKLIVSGGQINNVIIKAQQGSGIVLEGGGRIKHNKNSTFKIPAGVTLEQRWGVIE